MAGGRKPVAGESRERAQRSLRSLGSEWIFSFLHFVCKQFPFLWNGREASFVPNGISRFLSSGIASSKIPVTFLQSKLIFLTNAISRIGIHMQLTRTTVAKSEVHKHGRKYGNLSSFY